MPAVKRKMPTTAETPYSPLHREALGKSVMAALLNRPEQKLSNFASFLGSGVYAIFYRGSFPLYKDLIKTNTTKARLHRDEIPLYVGKAIPNGGRTGREADDSHLEPILFSRLKEHQQSLIAASKSLSLLDFSFKHIVTEDIWIALTERMLIRQFQPLWNSVLSGFGNHPPGKGRIGQMRSPWDTIHPGRAWATRLPPNAISSVALSIEARKVIQSVAGNMFL